MRRRLIAFLAAVCLGPALVDAQAPSYDIVIRNGRVIDPESNGVPVVADGVLKEGVYPGRGARGPIRVDH